MIGPRSHSGRRRAAILRMSFSLSEVVTPFPVRVRSIAGRVFGQHLRQPKASLTGILDPRKRLAVGRHALASDVAVRGSACGFPRREGHHVRFELPDAVDIFSYQDVVDAVARSRKSDSVVERPQNANPVGRLDP